MVVLGERCTEFRENPGTAGSVQMKWGIHLAPPVTPWLHERKPALNKAIDRAVGLMKYSVIARRTRQNWLRKGLRTH